MTYFFRSSTLPAALMLGIFLLLVLKLYTEALGGRLLFDDMPNLEGLASVFVSGSFHADAALRFVLSGEAGPLGRPLALLTFLLDGSGWPTDVAALLYTNSLLHTLNAVLLVGVLLSLGRNLGWDASRAAWIAVLSSAMWALSPLLASSSLMPIQRMTLLSSAFMLAGMWGYLAARKSLQTRPLRSLSLMWLALLLGGVLGVLSKEQAALLPTFVLVLEVFLLPKPVFPISQPAATRFWQAFYLVTLVLPTLLILAYLVFMGLKHEIAYATRDFSFQQRVASELVILWDYVRLNFLPRPASFSPFHDGQRIFSFTDLAPWVALAAWVALVSGALFIRRHSPWLAFTLFWFLAAHLLESSLIPLELYFEHRNYLAFVGAWFALVAVGVDWALRAKALPALGLVFAAYAGVLAFSLWQVTTLYGNPRLAAEVWLIENPHSERAAQFLAEAYWREGDLSTTLKVLDEATARSPRLSGMLIQGYQIACVAGAESTEQLNARLDKSFQSFNSNSNFKALVPTLDYLRQIMQNQDCRGTLTPDLFLTIKQHAMKNPNFAADIRDQADMEIITAGAYMLKRQLEPTMLHIETALDLHPDFDTLELALTTLNSAGLFEQGLTFIDRYAQQISSAKLNRTLIQTSMQSLRQRQVELVKQESSAKKS